MVNSAPAAHHARYLSKATGDILKAIHSLQGGAAAATSTNVALPSEIAARTGTSRAFVTKMLKLMKEHHLVEYTPYRGVRLTDEGTRVALEMARHHRLLEFFLANTLGFPLDAAHVEAERLEHVISEEFEARLDAFLGHPRACPHGAPIPGVDGTYPETTETAVSERQ